MRRCGKGYQGLRRLIALLNHPPPMTENNYRKINLKFSEAVRAVAIKSVPKDFRVNRVTFELGVYDAVSYFNDGNISTLKIYEEIGLVHGYYTTIACNVIKHELTIQDIRVLRLIRNRGNICGENVNERVMRIRKEKVLLIKVVNFHNIVINNLRKYYFSKLVNYSLNVYIPVI